MSNTLFDNDPAFMEQPAPKKQKKVRNRLGQFCTPEQLHIEKVEHENVYLRHDRQKYLRAWLAVCERCSRLERELIALKEKLRNR